MKQRQDPILFCFCGPGGSGKSSICTELGKRIENTLLSISTTSRLPRGAERDAREYFFVSKEDFEARIAAGRFLEHAVFNGNYYGTELRNVDLAKEKQADLLLDIEVQGVQQLRRLYPKGTVTIFVFPPSFEILKERLRDRKTDTEERIGERLKLAEEEVRVLLSDGFSDYFIENGNFEAALVKAQAIVLAERCRFSRNSPNIG